MKKYIVSILVASVFMASAPFAINQASAKDLSIRDFVNLLVIIGVITPDKMPAVNAFLASLDNPVTPPTQLTNTFIPSTTFMNFNVVQGTANPQPTSLVLTNASSKTVNFTISVPNQPAWLNTGYNTQTMTVNAGGVIGVGASVDATKVNGPGTYTTNLIFTGNFPNSPITVPITLTVSASDSIPSPLQPSITDITPTQGSAGTVVTIKGFNLSGASSVEFYAAGSQFVASVVPSSVTSNRLKFTISGLQAANMANGFYQVGVVTNACAGGCDSNRIGFTLNTPTIQPTATILTSSEITNPEPYIIGTASGVDQVGVVIGQFGDKIYGSGLIPVINGNWSVTVTPALTLGHYTIYVYDANNKQLANKSLNIVSQTQPTIAVISPNGGETFTAGQTVQISFSTNLTDQQDPTGINLQLYREQLASPGYVSDIARNYVSGSPYNWTVPNNLAPGLYYIYASASVIGTTLPEGGVYDFSNNPFTIVAASTNQPPTLSINPASVISGQSVTLSYTVPSDITSLSLTLSCPDGVSMGYGRGGNDNCNTRINWPGMVPTASTMTAVNTSSTTQTVTASLSATHPDGSVSVVPGQIIIQPQS